MPAYKRILLKLSGEALMGDDAYGINRATIVRMVREIQDVMRLGCEVAVVIGGGNIFRGVAGGAVGMDRATPAPGVLDAIRQADVILLPPSNPVVSIGIILGVPGVRDALRGSRAPVESRPAGWDPECCAGPRAT